MPSVVTTNRSEERILKQSMPSRSAIPPPSHNQSIRGEDTETSGEIRAHRRGDRVTTNRSEERILKLRRRRSAAPQGFGHNQSIRGEDTETGVGDGYADRVPSHNQSIRGEDTETLSLLVPYAPVTRHNQSIRGEDTETSRSGSVSVLRNHVTTNRSEERILKRGLGIALRRGDLGHNQSIRGEDTETAHSRA